MVVVDGVVVVVVDRQGTVVHVLVL